MRNVIKYFALVFLVIVQVSCLKSDNEEFKGYNKFTPKTGQGELAPHVLLISIDGFRHDYIEKFNPPNLKRFQQSAAVAESLIPVFPSNTFPNHYSMITGSYPENHGIVDNSFYDPQLKRSYSIGKSSMKEPVFYKRYPMWQVVEMNNIKSASYFWLGSDIKINGRTPTYYFPFDLGTSQMKRVNQVLDWYRLPVDDRPRFISLYFSAVDSVGHSKGPNSEEIEDAVMKLDESIGKLLDGIERLPFDVNVIFVSDHGMYEVQPDHIIDLGRSFAAYKPEKAVGRGALIHIYEKDPAKLTLLINSLRAEIHNQSKNFDELTSGQQLATIYRRDEIPKSYNYSKTDRVGDAIVEARLGFYLSKKSNLIQQFIFTVANRSSHGWNPDKYKEMHGFFMAKGPNIDPKRIESFKNIHVYPLIIKIMNLDDGGLEYDGDIKVLESIYKK